MEIMLLGGPVMWPLLFISIAALAIIIERAVVIAPYKIPKGITVASGPADVLAAAKRVEALGAFCEALEKEARNEERVRLIGQSIVAGMEKRLAILAVLAKCATLLGLLGTILGMIQTFSVIAGSTGGIDMTLLARGLWQALITTAAGLAIAIPSFIALALFEGRADAMAQFLSLAGNICVQGAKRHSSRAPKAAEPISAEASAAPPIAGTASNERAAAIHEPKRSPKRRRTASSASKKPASRSTAGKGSQMKTAETAETSKTLKRAAESAQSAYEAAPLKAREEGGAS